MALTDCNLPNRVGRSVHAGKDHGDKGERGRLMCARSVVTAWEMYNSDKVVTLKRVNLSSEFTS